MYTEILSFCLTRYPPLFHKPCILHISESETELQKVVDLPPNLKFMLSTFLILTQYIITGKQHDGVLCSRQKHVIRDLPMSLVCLSASTRALTKFIAYKEQRKPTVVKKRFII